MSTTTRPVLSTKSPYWISKHRYYELKHFCLQYCDWKRMVNMIDTDIEYYNTSSVPNRVNSYKVNKPTEKLAVQKTYFLNKIEAVEKACQNTDPSLGDYILEAVTKGFSYYVLQARTGIPCSKSTYYELYRKFFWLLDKELA